MRRPGGSVLGVLLAISGAAGASAADLLPLKHGIFVPTGSACKDAANAEIVDYRGGAHSLGDPHTLCTIRTLERRGKAYTLSDSCTDFGSGAPVRGRTMTLVIASSTRFRNGDTQYRYCGRTPRP